MGVVYRWAVRLLLVVIGLSFAFNVLLIERPGLLLGETFLDQSAPTASQLNPDLTDATPILDLRGGVPRTTALPARTVAITFDDGPDPTWTPQIQAVLDRHGVPGTFFVIGRQVLDHPELVQALDAAGHEIGNHTFTHPKVGQLTDWQVRLQYALTQQAVIGAIGKAPRVFRPPYSGSARYLPPAEAAAATAVSQQLGLITLLSDRIPADYNPEETVESLVADALPPLGAGGVIVFHDGGGDRSKTVAALDQLIVILKENGYRFVTASELAGIAGQPAPATGMAEQIAGQLLTAKSFTSIIVNVLLVGGVVFVAYSIVRAVFICATALWQRRREMRSPDDEPFLEPVSVVVPAYNEEVGVAAAVQSIAASVYPDVEIIVVDDGSTDRTAEVVEELRLPNVHVIRQPNGGKPTALNTGVVNARHDVIVMVDGDTIFETRTIQNLVQPFRDPMIGAVAGNAKVGNRARLWPRLQHAEYSVASALERRSYAFLGSTGCVPGAIGAFRKATLLEVGGVSADTLAEDADLTAAIVRAGWNVGFVAEARAWTEVPTTLRGLYRQRFRWSYGVLQTIAKHRHAVVETGPGGRFGRRVLPQTIFGYVGALLGPMLDYLVLLNFVINSSALGATLALWGVLNIGIVLTAALALRLEREPLWPALLAPLNQFVYRQVIYIAVLRSVGAALCGIRLPWNKIRRLGNLTIAPVGDDGTIDLTEAALIRAGDA